MWLQGSREGVNVTTLQTELGEEGATDLKRHGRTINLSLTVELKGVKYALEANIVYHVRQRGNEMVLTLGCHS